MLTLDNSIVSNGSLSVAAIKQGLCPFILTKAFSGKKWRPLYISTVLAEPIGGSREISTKTLADVVEGLIGAAFQDGGLPKAITCLKVFKPDVDWSKASDAHDILYEQYNKAVGVTSLQNLDCCYCSFELKT